VEHAISSIVSSVARHSSGEDVHSRDSIVVHVGSPITSDRTLV
jgi:hypothetical protein